MKHREFKDRLYAELGRITKALDNPRRLELVDLLAQGERSVEELAGEGSLSIANASQHLQVLRRARLVETRKNGLRVYYRLAHPAVQECVQAVRALAEARLAEVDQLVRTYLGGRDGLEAVSRDDLARRMREGAVVVVDVRPRSEYRAGHIRGALSIPVEEIGKRLDQLPVRKDIVAYCRGPYCVMAYEAVAKLRAGGRRARRLAEGFPEWRAAGLPIEAGGAS